MLLELFIILEVVDVSEKLYLRFKPACTTVMAVAVDEETVPAFAQLLPRDILNGWYIFLRVNDVHVQLTADP